MRDLHGKVVWIVGASSGIGEALTHEFARAGSRLVVSARRREELERVARGTGLAETDRMVLPLDLLESDSFPAAYRAVLDRFGRVDVLVHSGGVTQRSLFLQTDIAVLRRIVEANFYGVAALTRVVLAGMVEQGSGAIVVVTSVMGKFSSPLRSAYCASKHALHGLFDAIRAETSRWGIEVLLVAPGFIRTDISLKALTGDGTPYGIPGSSNETSMPVEVCARQIVAALRRGKREIYPGGMKEKGGVYLSRFAPGLLARLIRRVSVT